MFAIISALQWFFIAYFVVQASGYLLLNVIAIIHILRYRQASVLKDLPQRYSGFETPVTILVPAYNEEATITTTVRSLFQLHYSEYEVIVINDGSDDNTLNVLIQEFSLRPFPETYDVLLPAKPIRKVYGSATYPNLRVIDKERGGKADALNAGINLSKYPLFCSIDADSVLQRDSLQRVVEPFLEAPTTVAGGGTVRVANGCDVQGGFLVKVGLPRNLLALYQVVEYLRAFMFGRMGWSPLNALLVISGAFAVFRKGTVISAGGYRTDTVGEDMELVVRLHRKLRRNGEKFRITFVPDPICWTEVPEDLRTLRNQRIRWHRGLSESLTMNLPLLFHPRSGAAGWISFPFTMLFEWISPVVEVTGYSFMIVLFALGYISSEVFAGFLIVTVGFGSLLSVCALLLEEISFHVYPRARHILLLFLAAAGENLGYRQLISIWKLVGLCRFAFREKARWGEMVHRAPWKPH